MIVNNLFSSVRKILDCTGQPNNLNIFYVRHDPKWAFWGLCSWGPLLSRDGIDPVASLGPSLLALSPATDSKCFLFPRSLASAPGPCVPGSFRNSVSGSGPEGSARHHGLITLEQTVWPCGQPPASWIWTVLWPLWSTAGQQISKKDFLEFFS